MTEKTAEMLDEIIASNPHKIVLGGGKGEYRKIVCGKKQISGKLVYQLEKYTDKQVFHENIGEEDLKGTLGGYIGENFRQLNSFAVGYDYELRVSKKGEPHLTRKKSDKKQVTIQGNNRKKKYILEEGMDIPVFKELGIFTKDGKVAKPMYDKFKQINRFLEFIDEIVKYETVDGENNDAEKKPMRIIDFGCGKSYLTFIVYYYFTFIRKIPVQMTGVDLKEDVIDFCTKLAEKYGYSNLHFQAGDIADCAADETIDMVITLHACDTATDYALYNAVKRGAKYILSVPCCQHELAGKADYAALPIFDDNGILRERVSALITDSIRQKLLTACGYRTGLMEFVDLSHTPKNLLLRAKKTNLTERTRRSALKTAEDTLEVLKTEQKLHELLKKDGYFD